MRRTITEKNQIIAMNEDEKLSLEKEINDVKEEYEREFKELEVKI